MFLDVPRLVLKVNLPIDKSDNPQELIEFSWKIWYNYFYYFFINNFASLDFYACFVLSLDFLLI